MMAVLRSSELVAIFALVCALRQVSGAELGLQSREVDQLLEDLQIGNVSLASTRPSACGDGNRTG